MSLSAAFIFIQYNKETLIILLIVFSVIILVIIYKFFIINPLKRKNEIWYEISLFEKDIADTFQQIIPDSDKNKKIVNYPVDKTLKQPFALQVYYWIMDIYSMNKRFSILVILYIF